VFEDLMRVKIRYLVAAVVVAVVAWVAAPALSSRLYIPEAKDFEQALPAVKAPAGKGPVSYRTPSVVAPERFDLVGLAGEMRPVEIRARDTGGDWSDWVKAEDGNPVYVGGADELQLRTRGWRPRGTLHYVNVSGTTSAVGGLLTGARRAINSAFISVSSAIEPEADAAPTRPDIVTRSEWGADRADGGCKPRTHPAMGTVKAAVIHHTVTANDYSAQEAPGIVLGICRYHRNANGWNDIGYQALVDRFGTLYVGRAGGLAKPVVGAQAQGFNAQTTAIASIGTHTKVPITPEAKASIVNYLAWRMSAAGLQAIGKTTLVSAGGELSRYRKGRRVKLRKVIGHGTIGLTACPGDALERQIPQIRHAVQREIERGGGPSEPPPPPPPDDGGTGGTGGSRG
jgi:N-acetylmuramoyl-L-alanine amidase